MLLFSVAPVLAVSATSSATATPANVRDQQITDLKNRIATKVAELKILSKTALVGTVKTLSDQKIVITVPNSDISLEISSEDTRLSQIDQDGNSKSLKIDKLTTGQKIIAWGTYNSETQNMTADAIVARDFPQTFVGQIKSVDKKNYQFLVTNQGKDLPYLFDVNPPTKISLLKDDNNFSRSGFSKLAAGQTVYVWGFIGDKTKDGQTLLSTKRIIVLSQAESTASSPTSTPTATPKATKPVK